MTCRAQRLCHATTGEGNTRRKKRTQTGNAYTNAKRKKRTPNTNAKSADNRQRKRRTARRVRAECRGKLWPRATGREECFPWGGVCCLLRGVLRALLRGSPGGGLGRQRENRLGGPPCCGGGHRDPHLVYNDGGVGASKWLGHEREVHQLHHRSHPCELHYTHCRCVAYCTIPIPLTKFHRSERSRCI